MSRNLLQEMKTAKWKQHLLFGFTEAPSNIATKTLLLFKKNNAIIPFNNSVACVTWRFGFSVCWKRAVKPRGTACLDDPHFVLLPPLRILTTR